MKPPAQCAYCHIVNFSGSVADLEYFPFVMHTLPALAGHDGSAFSRRHTGQHAKRAENQLAKRQTYSNARFSFYDVTAGE